MNKNIQKIKKALKLIQEARELVHSVMSGDLDGHKLSNNYYLHGEYGLKQAIGKGRPGEGKLQDIINTLDTLEKESL